MAKKITDTQRLIKFAMAATEEGLTSAIETLKAVKDSRFAATPRKLKRPTRGRTNTHDAEAAERVSAGVNLGEA